jgi:hypothetical protein
MEILATSSGLKSADAVICARPCVFLGVVVLGDGTNTCNVVMYDNASAASGTVVGKAKVKAGDMMNYLPSAGEGGVVCNAGLYADVTGTGAEYIVYYSLL